MLGSFLTDFRNSRGKFDEIKDEFVINPAPIPLDHDELKIFLEIRLIPSRIDQKLRTKKRVHGFLKGELGRRSWVIGADVDADLQHRGSGFLARRRSSRICGEFSSKLASMNATFAPRSGHDHAVIGPQSWVDP